MNRDEFMELVYGTFADEPDNVLANGIIEAADAYVEHEKAQLSKEGTTKDTTADTISRQDALDILDSMQIAHEQGLGGYAEHREQMCELPPVTPAAKTGTWVNTNPGYKNGFYNNSYRCSACGFYYTTSPNEMHYCPHCGAKMKGEPNETD